MNEMRAALYDRYGPPDVLYEGRVPRPVPARDEVLVRVRGSSVNGGELYGRTGRFRVVTGLQRGFPKPVGIDFAGEVVATGPDVTAHRPGDRVWGLLPRRFGSTAEFVAVHPRQIARAPRNVDLVHAAALPAVGTTAITALRDKAGLRPGERLLVRGGSGGVGSVAVQLGRAVGARVTALVNAKHRDAVLALGADEALDYRTTVLEDRFDVVLDTVGTELADYRALLTPTGRMVAIAFDVDRMAASLAYIVRSTMYGRTRVRFFSGNPHTDLLAELTRLTENGAIRPVVDSVHPLAEIANAHRALEAGGVLGKVVVEIQASGADDR